MHQAAFFVFFCFFLFFLFFLVGVAFALSSRFFFVTGDKFFVFLFCFDEG